MSSQLTLSGFEPSEEKELTFLNSIQACLYNAMAAHGGTPEMLAFRPTKANRKTGDGYTSVFCGNFTVFRVKLRRGQHYISFPASFRDMVPPGYPVKSLRSDAKYLRLLIDEQHPAEFYTDFLVKLTCETLNRYPKEWDCCSRYMECSDAKGCVHPDKTFALGCGYRKILNSGRIFYGANRNID